MESAQAWVVLSGRPAANKGLIGQSPNRSVRAPHRLKIHSASSVCVAAADAVADRQDLPAQTTMGAADANVQRLTETLSKFGLGPFQQVQHHAAVVPYCSA